MGYTTEFFGEVRLSRPLKDTERAFLHRFASDRHGGCYHSHIGFPGLFCQWVPNGDGTAIGWDGGEKFYNYTEWLRFIIGHLLAPKGIVCNGEIRFSGEDEDDNGTIEVKDNTVCGPAVKGYWDEPWSESIERPGEKNSVEYYEQAFLAL